MTAETEAIRRLIKRELPSLIKDDPELQALILNLSQGHFADRQQTGDRFQQTLAELRRDREARERKWEAQEQKWESQERRWEGQDRKWEAQVQEAEADRKTMQAFQEEQARKWDKHDLNAEADRKTMQAFQEEHARKWDKQDRKAEADRKTMQAFQEEQARKWDDQKELWAIHRQEFDRMHEAIMAIAQKHDRGIGALGARWGMQTEAAFRNALAGILEKSFGVQVVNVTEYDDEGTVFGRPDQVELDIIIKNGVLILCEIKSSIDKAGMYSFERNVRFYEKRHCRTADRMMVISPMIDKKAMPVAARLGIETFSDASDVETDIQPE